MELKIRSEFFDPPTAPRIIAHRGGAGEYPENTLEAFTASYRLGVRYFELDIRTTRDGTLVVCHDADLERTTDRSGHVSELSYAEVAQADAGYRMSRSSAFPYRGRGIHIPRLDEVLTSFADCRFVIEIKEERSTVPAGLNALLSRTEMRRRVLIASEHQKPLDAMRTLAPDLPTGFSALEVQAFIQAAAQGASASFPGQAVQIPPRYHSLELVTPLTVAAAHRLRLEMHVWTVNEVDEMRALLELGVDGILTDYPARLLTLVGRASDSA